MGVVEDSAVKVWRGRLGFSFGKALRVLERFMSEGLDDELRCFSPSRLVSFQEQARGREKYRILRCAQSWTNGLPLRISSKGLYLSFIRSFFLHNMVELPSDRSFSFKSDTPPVDGNMDLERFRRILLNCNKMYKAVFLMMAQGIMGEGELVYVSNNHAAHVLKCLGKGGIFKIVLPGRKKTRNVKNFYTMLSCNSDWADAMRDYLRSLKRVPSDCLFRNQAGSPLNTNNINYYFHSRAVEAGVIKPKTPACRICNGETLKGRSEDRKTVYVCKECGYEVWAEEMENFGLSFRYGVNPHEIRDLSRTRWHLSGADPLVAEFMMQHDEQVDPNHYNKFAKYEPAYSVKEYRRALPWLNVLSHDPAKVDRSDLEARLEARDAETEVLRREIGRLSGRLKEIEGNELLADVELLTHIPGGEELFKEIVDDAKGKLRRMLEAERLADGK